MTPRPTAMIQRLPNRNAIEPGLKRTAFSKAANAPKRPQENFLRYICRFAGVAQHTGYQAEHGPVIMSYEPIESRLRTAAELRHQPRLVLGPGQDAGRISHSRLFVSRQTAPDKIVSH